MRKLVIALIVLVAGVSLKCFADQAVPTNNQMLCDNVPDCQNKLTIDQLTLNQSDVIYSASLTAQAAIHSYNDRKIQRKIESDNAYIASQVSQNNSSN